MEKEIIKIYEELTRLSIYDESTKTYYVNKENYYILGLSNINIRTKINQYANTLGVTIDLPNKNLPVILGTSLFEEYNKIKHIIDSTTNEEEKSKLEETRIKIRNIIAEKNLNLIKFIINRKINSSSITTINNNYEIEELYQSGYEFLLKYIDTHYLEKESFKYYINSLLIINVKRSLAEEIGISEHSSKELLKLKKEQNINEILLSLNIDESRLEHLLNICNIVNPIEYEEIDESNNKNNPLEDMIIYNEQKEQLLKIIKTLPKKEQEQLISLFCGLNGEKVHTYKEVAEKFGVTEGTISHRKKTVLTYLTSPLRTKYIKQIIGIDLSEQEKNISLQKLSTIDKRVLKQLEYFLLRQLDNNTLDTLTEKLSDNQKEILYISLGYISKSEKYINDDHLYQRKKAYILDYIRNKITEIYVINNKNEDINNYLDYLMYYYLNKSNIKRRTR